MRTELPIYWCIENRYDEVRNYLANLTDQECLRDWGYFYIGMDGCTSNKGVHGSNNIVSFYNNAVEITFEEFERLVLNKEISYEVY